MRVRSPHPPAPSPNSSSITPPAGSLRASTPGPSARPTATSTSRAASPPTVRCWRRWGSTTACWIPAVAVWRGTSASRVATTTCPSRQASRPCCPPCVPPHRTRSSWPTASAAAPRSASGPTATAPTSPNSSPAPYRRNTPVTHLRDDLQAAARQRRHRSRRGPAPRHHPAHRRPRSGRGTRPRRHAQQGSASRLIRQLSAMTASQCSSVPCIGVCSGQVPQLKGAESGETGAVHKWWGQVTVSSCDRRPRLSIQHWRESERTRRRSLPRVRVYGDLLWPFRRAVPPW